MKRLCILVTVLGLGLASGPAATAKAEPSRVERTIQRTYGPLPAAVSGGCPTALAPATCLTIWLRSTDAFFTADVKDAHGLPVNVRVYHRGRHVDSSCGRTSRPVEIDQTTRGQLTLWLDPTGTDLLTCPQGSVITSGTIRVTVSNRP